MIAITETTRRARCLRRQLTLPEGLMWRALRGRALADLRFRRQHPIGPYILDFYCHELKLAVEVDGQVHEHPERLAHDRRRTEWLRQQGIRVIRIAARDVLDDLDASLGFIRRSAGR
jgi:very-short-patch-repair endonuclease